MRQLKLGWVGSGFIGQVAHLANYAELPDVDIVALAELRPKLGALACRKYGIQRYYSDHRELLEDPDIEAVVAIVRRKHTAPVALDILNRGVHLFTEKPFAPTVEQGRELVDASKKNECTYAFITFGAKTAQQLDTFIYDEIFGRIFKYSLHKSL